ncbi:hypothetical protein LTS08_001117 [Lithohypha guttulata]|nr:hypothetical protein LTS08_001117 [Lithohypha guttulata]
MVNARKDQRTIAHPPATSPPLSKLEKQISTERTFETVLERDIMVKVSAGLCSAWPFCYADQDLQDVAEIGKGDKARRGIAEEDDRFYADWAGIRACEGPISATRTFKWNTSEEGRKRTDYVTPFNQIQSYCGRQWGCRYGYIITPEKLVVVRVSKESIGPGLATARNLRHTQPPASVSAAHARSFSVDTVSPGLKDMSLDEASSYQDDTNPDTEYRPLVFRRIPWDAPGTKVLTVKMALWWLHMLDVRN